jgi:hypothetical protein
MSNSLAIATVTAALAQIVRSAIQGAVSGSDVIIGRPESPPAGDALPRVRLYLYQVTPNPALRNADLPSRGSNGALVKRPCAALELHYLFSFYGSETELQPQRMLGAVVRDLHAQPFLTRQMVQNVITGYSVLEGSNLHEAVEHVRFSPLSLSLEDQSKLWSVFFQTPHAVSVAYQASVVLIESDEAAQPALPVLKRGADDQGVDTLIGPFPALDSLYFGLPNDRISQPRPLSLPAAQMGLAVIAKGRNLSGETVLLRFEHTRRDLKTSADKELFKELIVAQGDLSASELKVLLPQPGSDSSQDDWAPGVYTVTAVEKRSGSDRDRTSNSLPFALSPIIAKIEPPNPIPINGDGKATITITCQPRVHKTQQALLLLAGREVVGQVDVANPDKVIFVIENAPTVNNELVRLRVDGIASIPFKRVDIPPPIRFEFDDSQRVAIT